MGNEIDSTRIDELRSSADILGVQRVECLGYADSGYGPVFYDDPPGRVRFARANVDEAAQRLAAVLRAEVAQLLLSYQRNGGYGHRDHVHVHYVGKRAAELAGTPHVLRFGAGARAAASKGVIWNHAGATARLARPAYPGVVNVKSPAYRYLAAVLETLAAEGLGPTYWPRPGR